MLGIPKVWSGKMEESMLGISKDIWMVCILLGMYQGFVLLGKTWLMLHAFLN